MLVIEFEDEELVRKLRVIAAHERRPVEQIVTELLTPSIEHKYAVATSDDPEFFGSGAHLAQIAAQSNIAFETPEGVEDMDEFLRREYTDYLVKGKVHGRIDGD